MTTQHNSFKLRNVGIFLPNYLSYIYKQLNLSHQEKTFYHSSSFNSPTSYISTYFSNYSPHYQEGQELDGFAIFLSLSGFLSDYIYSPKTSSFLQRRPDTLQLFTLYLKIFPCQIIPRVNLGFRSRYLIISSENISLVSTNCSRDIFYVVVSVPYLLICCTLWRSTSKGSFYFQKTVIVTYVDSM